jgi:polyhydroxyalkanoate synthesis regulator phasin
MGIFNQFKEAHEAMKNMSPDEIRQMMDQAKETQKMLDDMIEKKVEAMIKDKDLVSRDEVKRMIER